MQKTFVHTPVKNDDCSDCHDPHASDHGKLLESEPNVICRNCHADVAPDQAKSAHPDVAAGNCVKCHDPHSSGNKGNLLKAGNDLCQSCHKEVGDHIAQAKFKHSPVTKSCLGCHDPHSGKTTPALLTKAAPELCVACHKPDAAPFKAAHQNYPVAKADCVSCHDPHGSSEGAILWSSVHMPVKNKMSLVGEHHRGSTSVAAQLNIIERVPTTHRVVRNVEDVIRVAVRAPPLEDVQALIERRARANFTQFVIKRDSYSRVLYDLRHQVSARDTGSVVPTAPSGRAGAWAP